MLYTFLVLYFLNLVLDYPLQGTFLAEYKQKNNYVLFVHCAIWGLGIGLVLPYFGLFAWWKVIMLVFGHYAIDYWKCRRLYKKWPVKKHLVRDSDEYGTIYEVKPVISDWMSLYIDQALHIIQVTLCLI
jgi:hypothetical protein